MTIPTLTEEELGPRVSDEESGFGVLSTEKGCLPLKEMKVHARIAGLAYDVIVEQSFANDLDRPIEATYIFPLPDRAGVTGFRMQIADRIVEGEVKERKQARDEYDAAIRSGHRAAITEEERSGVFTLRVGNIMPREIANVRFCMTGPVSIDDGQATFRFPLVVAPRYIPGRALEGESVGDGVSPDTDAVPDASRITPPVLLPGFPNPVRLGLTVEIDPLGLPISDLKSSLHAVDEETVGTSRGRRIVLRPGERLDRDFVLRFKLGADACTTALALCPDEDGREGTFLLTLVPPTGRAAGDKPRDVVFVVDRSGSMEGWKMIAARRAVARMVDTLTERDRFMAIAFDDEIHLPASLPQDALSAATNRARFRAIEFLAALESGGGTEMAAPLVRAARLLEGGYDDRDRVLVLVTDGQVGNEDQLLGALAPHLKNTRIFTLGIDRAVNEGFLKRLAALGGGLAEIVESEERLDEVMDKIHRRLGNAVAQDLQIVPTGLEVDRDSIVPTRIPDLFAGAPISISGRYRGAGHGSLAVKGRDAVGGTFDLAVKGQSTDHSAITTLWARGRVRELEDRFAIGRGDKPDLERSIVFTSIRFKVLSRFTAFVAIDRSERVKADGELHKIIQPVEAPAGWEMFEAPSKQRAITIPRPGRPKPAPGPSIQAVAQRSLGARAQAWEDDEGGVVDASASIELHEALADFDPPPREKAASIRLDVYRMHAKATLASLRRDASPDRQLASRIEALKRLSVDLSRLVENLESVGAQREEIEPLARLAGELRAALVRGIAGEAEVSHLITRAETILEAFAREGARATFWKV
jgi:Ca-activated chloride channel family protein